MSVQGTYFTCDAVPGWASKGFDADGVEWRHASEITGWDEPPEARSSRSVRSNSSGTFDAPIYDDERVISWRGTVIAPTRALRESAKLKLGRLARALRAGATVTGHDEDGPKTVYARRSTGWKIVPFGPFGLQYQAQIACPDPYKYGPARTLTTDLPAPGSGGLVFPLFDGTGALDFGLAGVDGRLALANPGTDDAWPVFTVTGPVVGGLSITEMASGRQIVYAGDVPDGATLLIIDAAAGRATLNGADRTGELTVKQWFSVPPNLIDGSSDGRLDDAYLVDLGDDSAEISSPDLLDDGDDIGELAAVSDTTVLQVQFATFGGPGQTGTLSATVRPTYQ